VMEQGSVGAVNRSTWTDGSPGATPAEGMPLPEPASPIDADPVLAMARMIALLEMREEKISHKERHAAREEQEAAAEREVAAMHDKADDIRRTGIISGIGKIAGGACSVGVSCMEIQVSDANRSASQLERLSKFEEADGARLVARDFASQKTFLSAGAVA